MSRKKTQRSDPRPEIQRAFPLPTEGLSGDEVEERIRKGYCNTTVEAPTKTVRQIFASNILTYFNFIFFILAAALLAVGAYNDLTFLGVLAVNIAIGIVQEIHSKKTLDQLTLLSEPKVRVIRDGQELSLPVEDLVLDDIILLSAGNQICADAVVVDGSVQVNESLITGEADEVTKEVGEELLSGSYIVSGECRARLERVGADSFVSRLTLDAKKTKKKQQPGMMRSLTRLIQIIGVVIIPIGIIIALQQYFILHLSVQQTVKSTTAALISMIPEGLYLLTNVALAVSVVKLARKKTLVHDLKCIETLARVDVLCVDKTGTITEGLMQVGDIVPLCPEQTGRAEIENLLCDFTGNMKDDNNTMKTLKAHFQAPVVRSAQTVTGFSSATKYSAVSFSDIEHYLLGAPEFILGNAYESVRPQCESFAMQGNRVLLLARAERGAAGEYRAPVPLALILLSNRIRAEAAETFRYFQEQGVTVKVISGDNPFTAADAARQAGIPEADKMVDASTLKTEEDISQAAAKYTVFGRVTPEQKRQLLRALKKQGHTVAMTGDGVNDVLALKEADCSIAMASGSEVACQVSHLVLLDSNFASMPEVVAQGRQVINNIERSASLFLVKNIFSFFLSLISIFAVFAYPLDPAQISLISGVTIGAPAFFLALEPNHNRIRGKFLRNVLFRALPAAITDLFLIIGVILFSSAFAIPREITSTVAAILMGLVGFAMLIRICKPLNPLRVALILTMFLAFVCALLLFPAFFSISPLSFGGWLILGTLSLLINPVMKNISRVLDGMVSLFRRTKQKIRHFIDTH